MRYSADFKNITTFIEEFKYVSIFVMAVADDILSNDRSEGLTAVMLPVATRPNYHTRQLVRYGSEVDVCIMHGMTGRVKPHTIPRGAVTTGPELSYAVYSLCCILISSCMVHNLTTSCTWLFLL